MNIQKTSVILQPIQNILYYQPANVQRLLSEEYINYIVDDQQKEYEQNGSFSILQSLTCGDVNNIRYVLDGQHRLESFRRLQYVGYRMDQYIPLVVYHCKDFDELRQYYVRINQNHPINPLEISETWFRHGKDLCVLFVDKYSKYVKKTNKSCNCPYINMMELIEYLKNRKVFERLQRCINSADMVPILIEKINVFNTYLYENYSNIVSYQLSSDNKDRFIKCYNKDNTNPCFLGVWRRFEWLEICISLIINRLELESLNFSQFTIKRKRIPTVLKNNVWKKRNGISMEGVCYVCEEVLKYENMECGHIKSHILNGDATIDNLEPICKSCNRDMGAMNLIEYKLLFDNGKSQST